MWLLPVAAALLLILSLIGHVGMSTPLGDGIFHYGCVIYGSGEYEETDPIFETMPPVPPSPWYSQFYGYADIEYAWWRRGVLDGPFNGWSVIFTAEGVIDGEYSECGYRAIPLGSVFLVSVAIAGGVTLLSASIRQRRIRRGLCTTCGYSLTGVPSDSPCPECGQVRGGEHARTKTTRHE